jgi:23S rRNA pseudouridine1911/1915/1917 synthase
MTERLDKFLPRHFDVTRTQAAKLIEAGCCAVNGVIVTSKKYSVSENDEVELDIPPAEVCDILAQDIPLDIRYEDDDVIVVNKTRGMVVHPAPGHYCGTLVNALMWRYDSKLERKGIVHRIDKDTSGLLAVAKTEAAHLSLSGQLKERTMRREYETVVQGRVRCDSGEINAPIGRSSADRKKMCVNAKVSRSAITRYSVIANFDRFTHLRIQLETGRTHQIRVHMAYIGYPVAGDSVYGNGKPASLGGQCLHARKLGFTHPSTGEYIEIESELPDYFSQFLEQL